jgi:hypothetical protein
MKKLILIVAVIVCGCVPTREQEWDLRYRKMHAAFVAHPEWSEEMKEKIRNETFCTGMSVEQVELAWDVTLRLNYSSSSGRENYSMHVFTSDAVPGYDGFGSKCYSLWFRYGKLEDWSWSPGTCY